MTSRTAAPYVVVLEPVSGYLRGCCEYEGWQVDTVVSAVELLEALQVRQYEALIIDGSLVEQGLSELVRAILVTKPGQAIVLVQSEGKNTIDTPEGVGAVISRAVSPRGLVSAVLRVIARGDDGLGIAAWLDYAEKVELHYNFSSRDINEKRFPLPLLRELEQANLIDRSLGLKLELAFQEALANSVEHGNLELESQWKEDCDHEGADLYLKTKRERLADPNYGLRPIKVEVFYDRSSFRVSIKDGGQGFIAEKLSNPKVEIDELVCHGRGLTIIRETMDEVEFNANGSEIRMVKQLTCGQCLNHS